MMSINEDKRMRYTDEELIFIDGHWSDDGKDVDLSSLTQELLLARRVARAVWSGLGSDEGSTEIHEVLETYMKWCKDKMNE